MIDSDAAVGAILIRSSARAPQLARTWLAGVFGQCDLGDDYAARTVVTELVTNVHRHTDTEVIPVRLLLEDGYTVVEVEDRSDELPVVQNEDDTAESGRGLLMMSMLVEEWGVRALDEGGKVTWARLGA
ncbi:ATP-binding protein [Actinomadura formosensis]|uniref:ATP-binding protein n=1 Tax=Actinomadura formosensis TaxID=60706 RepID=UPI003D8F23A2